MRHWWSGIALLALGLCVIVLLGLLHPAHPRRLASGSDGLFVPIRSERLMDDGVADLLDPLPLAMKLTRVRWEPGILSVDLSISPGTAAPEALLGDAYELSRASFERVNNVRQLLIRFYALQDGRRTLLASADLRAADWASLSADTRQAGEDAREWAQSAKYHLIWTAAGREWLANFAF
ncbi:hypothetical protein [Cohnella sp. JJ-181]|uniref:hypothetical protein n=1 Tax=Cohnella rhizoplanae TaxID=2974897 RepID=UPI0022FF5F58|nr:hypothetical protein [Cohnella sp. JJ-181]CAI6080895.1 hypothetical protein COHCIP112018_03130 [Cohnella sp. JJ-181]